MTPPAAARVRHRVAAAVAVLLVGAAVLLILGVLLERRTESGAEHPIAVATTGEQAEGHHSESTEATRAQPDGGGEAAERLTGINAESPWIVALGSIASIALAVAVWLRPTRPIIIMVVAFTAAALILDVLETNHQLGAGRTGLAALAGAIGALRVATIIASAYLYRSRTAAA
ncbi:MAG: hypothetical protein JWR37_1428 [Mycobacterium sp.]|nr:hypothetical protein [Mycobacterium sp.]